MRKKTPTNTNTATAAVNLDDDEQLVEEITTTKKIGRQRRPPASEETITVEAEDDPDDDFAEPEFADGSLAAVLFGESGENNFENEFCTIQIRRNPDSMNDRFLTPCGAVQNLAPLRNIELSADKMDIEERVRAEYGGGHYYFQIYYGGKLGKSWKATLADDPSAVAKAKAEADAKLNPQPSPTQAQPPPPKDPMDSMIDSVTKMKLLKDALFGDEQARLQREIDDLKAKVAEKPEPSAEPKSEQLYILEKALGTTNVTLQEKLLDYAFPADGGGHWIPETIKTVFEHKDEIGGILGGLLGGLAPKPKANIADMLRAQPPAALPAATENESTALPTSSFRRRPIAAEATRDIDEHPSAFLHPPKSAEPPEGFYHNDDGDLVDTENRVIHPRSDAGEKTAAEVLANIEQPSAEFLASITISPDEVIDPYAIENAGKDADETSGETSDAE